jgi:hypothetical protein
MPMRIIIQLLKIMRLVFGDNLWQCSELKGIPFTIIQVNALDEGTDPDSWSVTAHCRVLLWLPSGMGRQV